MGPVCKIDQREEKMYTMHFLHQATKLEKSTAKITQLGIKGGNWKGWSHILTYSMEQSPSWKANQFAASQEIQHIVMEPKVFFTVLTSARHLSLSWANSIHTKNWANRMMTDCTQGNRYAYITYSPLKFLYKAWGWLSDIAETCRLYEVCPESIEPYLISREPIAWPWCNLAGS
jgi:hypothetical protein